MLPAAHRLRDSESFRSAVRRGRRAGSRTLVVHLETDAGATDASPESQRPARVGFVVSKAVGNAVVRNRVKRRLRELTRKSVPGLPGSAVLVVRALPPAAKADIDQLDADLHRLLDRVVR